MLLFTKKPAEPKIRHHLLLGLSSMDQSVISSTGNIYALAMLKFFNRVDWYIASVPIRWSYSLHFVGLFGLFVAKSDFCAFLWNTVQCACQTQRQTNKNMENWQIQYQWQCPLAYIESLWQWFGCFHLWPSIINPTWPGGGAHCHKGDPYESGQTPLWRTKVSKVKNFLGGFWATELHESFCIW